MTWRRCEREGMLFLVWTNECGTGMQHWDARWERGVQLWGRCLVHVTSSKLWAHAPLTRGNRSTLRLGLDSFSSTHATKHLHTTLKGCGWQSMSATALTGIHAWKLQPLYSLLSPESSCTCSTPTSLVLILQGTPRGRVSSAAFALYRLLQPY